MTTGPHQAHDEAVRAEHEEALARGEERTLYLTEDGMLHSYLKRELGGPPNGPKHWWANAFQLVFCLGGVALGVLVVVEPTFDGGDPYWRGLIAVGVFLPFVAACYWFMAVDYRAHKLRKKRGTPMPLRIFGAKTKVPDSYTESMPRRAI